MTRNMILNLLKIHKDEMQEKFGIQKIGLFGSYGKDEANSQSDVDLVVEMREKNYFTLIDLENYLVDKLHKKVDIGFFDSMKTFIKKDISKDIIYV